MAGDDDDENEEKNTREKETERERVEKKRKQNKKSGATQHATLSPPAQVLGVLALHNDHVHLPERAARHVGAAPLQRLDLRVLGHLPERLHRLVRVKVKLFELGHKFRVVGVLEELEARRELPGSAHLGSHRSAAHFGNVGA